MPLRSTITTGHIDRAPILEMGKILNVDTDNFLVDVYCEMSGRVHQDVQVMSPYFHYNNGEGFSVMPEVGAICVVVTLSDSNPPIVLGFAAALEETFTEEQADPDDTQEAQDASTGEQTDAPDEEGSPAFSFRNGRPLHRMGDINIGTRDGNFLKLRRGGVAQIGSTPMAQTIFMPIKNLIRTFAQNYELDLVGGSSRWEVTQEEDGTSKCVHTVAYREFAEHAMASAYLEIGDLDENFYRFRMLMEGINASTGEMSQSPVFELTLSKEGDIVLACKSNTVTIEEDQTIEVKGTEKETYGKLDREVKGDQKVSFKTETREGQTSKEKLKSKIIEADSVILGSVGGAQPMLKGTTVLTFLLTHGHPIVGGVAGPTNTPLIGALCGKVKGS